MNNELPALDHTPATDWANDTTSALGAPLKAAVSDLTLEQNLTTAPTDAPPGSNFPGAYPGGEESVTSAHDPLTGTHPNGGIINTVRQSLPAQQDVVDIAKQYLPAPVAAYLPGADAPSSEANDSKPTEQSTHETAKADAGSRADTSEKPEVNSAAKKVAGGTGLAGAGIGAKELIDKKKELDKEEAIAQQLSHGANKPINTAPHRVSTNSIPAASPTQPNAACEFRSTRTTTNASGPESSEQVGNPVTESAAPTSIASESGLPQSAPTNPTGSVSVNGMHETSQNKDFSNANGTSDHSAEVHSTNNKHLTSSDTPALAPTISADSHRRTGSTNTASSGSKSIGGTPRKVSLKDKIKGEVKVISGRLGGKPERVEEGKRILQGGA